MYSDMSTQVFLSVEHSHLSPHWQMNNLPLSVVWKRARDWPSDRVLDLLWLISIPTDITMVTG